MTPEQFCYWLNGFGELTTDAPTAEQWKAIKEHLETVFKKVTPAAPGSVNPFDELARKAREDARKQADPYRDPNGWGRALPNTPAFPYPGYPTITC